MRSLFRIVAVLLTLLTVVTLTASAAPYASYIYINGNEGITDVAAPTAYVPSTIYDSTKLDAKLSSPEDICRDEEGNFYVLNSSDGYIHCFSPEWEKKYTIFGYLEDGQISPTALNNPQGICLWGDTLYVAETGANRIAKFSLTTRRLTGFIEQPESDLFAEGFVFSPKKIAVDSTGRIFVVANNVFEGLMELTQEGDFVGYVGSNEVVANAMDIFWQTVMTEEQGEGLVSFIPVEYTNISLDPSGFIYAVTAASDVNTPIRRLNPSGEDVLVRSPVNGVGEVSGDLLYKDWGEGGDVGPSSFVDIAVNEQGIYFALDNKRGRIFAYDEDGNMLFEFGGSNTNQAGTFMQPSALEIVGDTVYVLDRERKCITAFVPTDYAKTIMDATRSFMACDYETSREQWESLLKRNCNFDLAYVKAGFCLYRMGNYEKAMEYFELANARSYYTKAFTKYRTQYLNEHFTQVILLAVGLVVLILLFGVWRRYRAKKRGKGGAA